MSKLFRLPETCPLNQWSAPNLIDAIEETAVAEQARRALLGEIVTLHDLRNAVSNQWLDAMMPAGNC